MNDVDANDPGFPRLAVAMMECGKFALAANLFMLAAKYAPKERVVSFMREANRALCLALGVAGVA